MDTVQKARRKAQKRRTAAVERHQRNIEDSVLATNAVLWETPADHVTASDYKGLSAADVAEMAKLDKGTFAIVFSRTYNRALAQRIINHGP